MHRLTFVVASDQAEVVEALAHSGRAIVAVAVDDPRELLREVAARRPDALLVDLGRDPHAVLDLLEAMPAPRPVLMVQGPDDSGVIVRAVRLGAREYLPPCADPKRELLAALERVLREHGPARSGARLEAPLVAVMGAKGGVGATFVSCQLAAGLARGGARVSLVDAHLRLGDVALYLDVHPHYTMASLASATDAVDAAYLQTVLAHHPTGVQVLAAPERPEEADLIGVPHLDRALSLLRQENEWVVVDTPRDFDERSVHVLDRAAAIVLVATSDVPALNHARLQLELLHRLGLSPHRVHVVLNRVDKRAPVQRRQAAEFLRRKVDLGIPNDYATASTCVNEGHPLWEVAPRGTLRPAFDQLLSAAHRWCEVPLPEDRRHAKGLLGRLRRN